MYTELQLTLTVCKILEESGFDIQRDVVPPNISRPFRVDIVATKEDTLFYIDIKRMKITCDAIHRISTIAQDNSAIPVLITDQQIDRQTLAKYEKVCPKVKIIDISNLLYAVRHNLKLRNELVSSVSYSVDNIEPTESFIEIESLQHSDYTDTLIAELNLCQTGNNTFRKYEELCFEMLKNLFSDDLTLWKEQKSSNKSLYKFDLLCRLKDGNQKTFWSILERFFNSKYVIFEFKNYTDKISQKEIYSTEKYLYAKALRSVAIVVAANGYSKNAYWAAKGSLRENGKLILLLDTNDLINMAEIKKQNEDPSEYLLEILDSLLMELEK